MKCISVLLAFALLVNAAARAAAPLPVRATHAMVVTEEHYASQVGVDMLKSGGNAVDAAVAVGYALAVVDPCCGNIGGGGFMLVRMHDGRERFIDFREKAPLRATRDMYLDKQGRVVPGLSTKGYLSVGVPGTVMGLERARTEFGTFARARLLAPAIALARGGYVLRPGDVAIYRDGMNDFLKNKNARAIFTNGGTPLRSGQRLAQSNLAATLSLIAKDGPSAFYHGPIAASIVAASRANGGILSLADFAKYTVDEQTPLHCDYRGYRIISSPPPSSGGATMCEILNIASGFPLGVYGWNSVRAIHDTVEAERRAYVDRNTYLGDPSFVSNPLAQLLSPDYAAKLRAEIQPNRATPSVDVKPGLGPLPAGAPSEGNNTTHFSIVDKAGNAVAVTYTINDFFGSGMIAGDTGFFLNDEMDDFTSKPGVPNMFGLVQGERNAIAPGKRPLSSMAPTIVTRNGKLFMVTGSPGGSRIITITLATIQNVIDYGMNVQQAVGAPRIHHQWLPDVIEYEPGALTTQTQTTLAKMGYRFRLVRSWGSAQSIVVDPKTGAYYGGTDPRRSQGAAIGY
ncbi:MAG: gamma-glutamyltransferase [Candidatus Eremiobacteraeota bacterium]|nr:gamma-glutamyltransferase [Candidatus Eremiobacteraeota bacterium]